MNSRIFAGMLLSLVAATGYTQQFTLTAPAGVVVGASVEVGWTGTSAPQDFVTIVPVAAAEGSYGAYKYARTNPVVLTAPGEPGDYEIRYLGAASPYPTLARQPLTVEDTAASLTAPASVAAGDDFDVHWTGPDNDRDFISLVAAGTPEGKYAPGYRYTRAGSPATLRAPDQAGAYEVRYLMADSPHRTLGRVAITVTGVGAAVSVPATVAAGAPFEIAWQGPDNAGDFLTIVAAGTAENAYEAYVYTERANPATLHAPEVPGDYEVRYLTGQTYATLATAAITVTPVTASLEAAATAPARDQVTVTWEGPGNPLDYVILLPAGAENSASGNYAYVSRGPELRIATPEEPGDYELRYLTGAQQRTLATRPITIVPRPAPGELRVVAAGHAPGSLAAGTVAVILDASGSMLQRIDGKRRIDVAKAAVTDLVATVLPESINFTLRVFGHKEAGSCRTDLEIPVATLNRSAAAAAIAAVDAMNLAKTPIAASLQLIAADLAAPPEPHLVILVTDGEETCDGDPAAVISAMVAQGKDVRVNIVGFAIDELMLQETFEQWAALGNGKYFNARDSAELSASLRATVDLPYRVLDASNALIASGTVNGPPISVDAGTYSVVALTTPPQTQTVTIEMETLTTVEVR